MADPLFDLSGKVIVITGGSGKLGGQFARALESRGARVASFDTLPPGTPAGDDGARMHVSVDVRDRASLENGLDRVVEAWGVPDGLVNCAAIDSPPDAPVEENGPFESYPRESWERVMSVNTTGVFLTCQVVGGAMAAEGRGSVVNIGSIYGLVSPDQRLYEHRRRAGDSFYKPVAYSVSKSALYNLTRYLATYWAPRGVRVNTVTFGGVFAGQHPDFLSQYESRVPLGRMADAQDYEGVMVFLLSPASGYVTGANLVVDGGWTAW